MTSAGARLCIAVSGLRSFVRGHDFIEQPGSRRGEALPDSFAAPIVDA